jgi:hypothetical protein
VHQALRLPRSIENASAWLKFVALFAGVFLGAIILLCALILLIDPYDSGRFPSFGITGIVDESPRTANVSRGRDPRFDAAIVGNSHGQLLAPSRLSQATGLRFVQLTVPGTGPREQFALLRWFMRHHPSVGALVLAADVTWCTPDASLPIANPFPFWLYGEGQLEYLANLLNTHSLTLGRRRVMLALGLRTPTDPAGYWDYEAGRSWAFDPAIPERIETAADTATPFAFPAIERLADMLAGLRAPVVVVMPPVFVTELPRPGSPEALRLDACKRAFAKLAAELPRTAFVDFLRDSPLARDPTNFMDAGHYRKSVAELIEADIAAALPR